MQDSPAAIAALTAMRQLLVLLRDKGVVTSNELVNMLNEVDPGIASEGFNHSLYQAYLWLKQPHLAESIVQTLEARNSR